MNNTSNGKLFGLVVLVFAATMLLVAPAWSDQRRAGDTSHRSSEQKDMRRGALEKTGFYTGTVNERVTMLEENTYRKLAYIASTNMIVTFQEQAIELNSLLPHSIVKLIIVDAEVVEIVLLQESE